MSGVIGIDLEEAPQVWAAVSPLLAEGLACAAGRYTLEDLEESIRRGDRALWVTWPELDCALVTQVDDFPGAKVFRFFCIGGKLPADWREIVKTFEDWAAKIGCNQIEGGGRKGWERTMPGYRVAPWSVLIKDLPDDHRRLDPNQ